MSAGSGRSGYVVAAGLLLCSALLSGCAPLGGSSASCGQSLPNVEPSRAAPGETFLLSGGGFRKGCNDTGPPFLKEPPQRGIRTEMQQGGETWSLATVDADPDYIVEAMLEVPTDAEPGGAVVVVHTGNSEQPLEVPFEVLGGGPS